LGRGNSREVGLERNEFVFVLFRTSTGQRHPRDSASKRAARNQYPRSLIRKMRRRAKRRPGITNPGRGRSSHILPAKTLPLTQISFEPVAPVLLTVVVAMFALLRSGRVHLQYY
jgi:hypothetical protein